MMPNELYPDLWDEFEAIKAELVPEHANVDVMVDGGFCISCIGQEHNALICERW